MTAPIVVDCHSHVFNAEDLPIDGFIKRLSPVPAFLTGFLSWPLDKLTAWVAENGGNEIQDLLNRLQGLEAVATVVAAEVTTDAEMEQRLVAAWPFPSAPPGLEMPGSAEDALAAQIRRATPEQLAELETWRAEWLSGTPVEEGVFDAAKALAGGITAAAKRYGAALNRICQPRHLVAAELAGTYPSVHLFAPALVDFEYTARDKPATTVQTQIAAHSLVAKLAAAGELPGRPDVRLHPMVGYCPYREVANSELRDWDVNAPTVNGYVPFADPQTATDADRYTPQLKFDPARARPLSRPTGPWRASRLHLDEVHRAIDLVRHAVELGGFAGVKVYPPSGFLPIGNVWRFGEVRGRRLDAALRTLYAYCEAQQVPILTHASHSNGFDDGYDDFAAPTGWALVLEDYPELRICFGHFGHMQGIGNDAAQPSADSWAERFVALIDKYPHVYADVGCSKFPVDAGYRSRYLEVLSAILNEPDSDVQSKRRRRLMFGTDFWLNALTPNHRQFLDVFRDEIERHFGDHARDEFMGGNALRFLGLRGEDDTPDSGNLNRQRLIDFYGGNPVPDWF